MSESLKCLFCALSIAGLFSCGGSAWDEAKTARCRKDAIDFTAALEKGDFQSFYGRFDGTMKAALTLEKLKAAWEQVSAQAGALTSTGDVEAEVKDNHLSVILHCRFAKTNLILQIVFNDKEEISGFWARPDTAAAAFKNPPYYKPDSFSEREISVGSGLNHLFMEGTGPSLPQEYSLPGNIPEQVITDIAEWIGSQA
jgi:hypothetical protein